MARGIDTEAHRGCLDEQGITVAVLGTGIDVPYPRQNRALMEKISETGCVVSEFPPRTPGLPQNFPQRNRIVSGLSSGVVVVEAPKKSGALITARFALEQGKTVLAVPGEIWSKNSKGSHLLLRDGAVPVLEVQDVLDSLGWERCGSSGPKDISPEMRHDLSPTSSRLIACLNHKPLHIDEIATRCDLKPAVILGELLKLEMIGLVTQRPGKYFNLQKR
jgi:DNA processing protein